LDGFLQLSGDGVVEHHAKQSEKQGGGDGYKDDYGKT
jgi:hypothetical protein